MYLCKVMGKVTSELKVSCLTGKSLLICEDINKTQKTRCVAADLVGVTVGATVLVALKTDRGSDGDYCDAYVVAMIEE